MATKSKPKKSTAKNSQKAASSVARQSGRGQSKQVELKQVQAKQSRSRQAQPKQVRPKQARQQSRMGRQMRGLMREKSLDIAGLLLILAGVIIACGVYGDFAGTLGNWLDTSLGATLGVMRFLLPPAMVALGVSLVLERSLTASEIGFRICFGSALLLVGATGMAHILGGQPRFGEGTVEEFASAGGLLGATSGIPLQSIMGGFAASFVLLAIALFGFVIACRTTLGKCLRAVGVGLRAVGKGVAALWRMADRLDLRSPEEELEGADTQSAEQSAAAVSASDKAKELTPYDSSQDDFSDEFLLKPSDSGEDAKSESDEQEASEEPVATEETAETAKNSAKPDLKEESKADVADEDEAEDLSAEAGDATSKPKTDWQLPSLSLLELAEKVDLDETQARERGEVLEEALAAHGVDTKLVGMVVGPTVTRYELELGEGTKVAKVTSLNKDIAYSMASPDVRILAPIPGRRAIGVEVPNTGRQAVLMGDILSSPEAKKASHPLDVAVGRDITGRSIMLNLARMPHLLIAGSTGSGKSSCLNVMIASLLMRTTPDELRMILVDPKMVEMRQFAQVPHLLTEPVTDPKKAANALAWAVKEMDRRYRLLSTAGFRDIAGYNDAFDQGMFGEDEEFPRLPFILVVVDELSDLMMVAARDVEDSICRIAQMARAVGIHLVIATQRPSTNVITGVIKANIPARLAFSVSSLTDSRVILDQGGAERLVGQGDMLLLGPSSSAPRRVQGAWVSEAEVKKVVGAWRRQCKGGSNLPGISSEELSMGSGSVGGGGASGADSEDDELLQEAMEIVVSSGLGSTSMLQRKLRVGFARAGRLMDLLEQKGIVGPSEGSKAREVYMTPEELSANGLGSSGAGGSGFSDSGEGSSVSGSASSSDPTALEATTEPDADTPNREAA